MSLKSRFLKQVSASIRRGRAQNIPELVKAVQQSEAAKTKKALASIDRYSNDPEMRALALQIQISLSHFN